MPTSTCAPLYIPLYVIAIGSNRRGRHGSPEAEVRAAVACLPSVAAVSRIVRSAPVGPSTRRYANAAAVIACDEEPPVLLARLKAIERAFGRRPGQVWGARVLDLDIVLWSGGAWSSRRLTVPHVLYRERDFVLGPLLSVAPEWRDPLSGLTVRQLETRLRARRLRVDPAQPRP